MYRLFVSAILITGSTSAMADVQALRDDPPGQTALPTKTTSTGSEARTFQLQPAVTHLMSSWPDAVEIADVTGDGRADVVVTTTSLNNKENDYHVFVFPQTAGGQLSAPSKYPYGQTAYRNGLAIVDLDGKHGLDVVVGGDSGITTLFATASGTLAVGGLLLSQESRVIEPVDLRGTGRKDLVSLDWTSGYIHYNQGAGAFLGTPWAVQVSGSSNNIAITDFDGDGHEDIVLTSGGEFPNVQLYRNQGDGSLRLHRSLSAACDFFKSVGGVAAGDVNSDGIVDIVATAAFNRPASCLVVHIGKGDGTFEKPLVLPSYDIPQTVRIADVNDDGRDDVVVLHAGWGALGIYMQQGDGSLTSETLYPIPNASQYSPEALAIGDFSGDGCPDVAIAGYSEGLVTLLGAGCASIFMDGFD